MILYHPVYDVNHCIYRMLLILETSTQKNIPWELFRLMDFYLLFPHVLKEIEPFPIKLKPFKAVVRSISDAYETMPNKKRIIFSLESIQSTAIQNLMAKGLINVELFKNQVVSRTEYDIPVEVMTTIESDNRQREDWYRLIINELPLIEFEGKGGLKARSKLMEYRYDN